MSHYAVAVFSNTPDGFDDLLAPYSEDDESFFTPHYHDEEIVKKDYEKFLESNPSWRELGYDYYLKEMGYKREDGRLVTYRNDNAKWDYYTLGGRDYMFDYKKEVQEAIMRGEYELEESRKNDYDYSTPDDCGHDAARFWDVFVDGKPPEPDEEFDSFWKREYYLERYGTKERYIEEMQRPTTPYAFITPDGVWHAPGEMGWFACDNATYDSTKKYYEEWMAYIKSDENPYVSFVDCHI